VHTLKLDGSFVRGVCDSSNDVAIVDATIALARSFGLRVVAEGVETADQHALLKKLGCDDCQGYHTFRRCRPPPWENFWACSIKLSLQTGRGS